MATFFKTFLICMIVAVGFFVYKFLMSESYSPDLSVSNDNPVFSNHYKFDFQNNSEEIINEEPQLPIEQKFEDVKEQKPDDKYEYTCYFYSSAGKLTPVKRAFTVKQSLESSIEMLLKGPTILEVKNGIYSEIPKNVNLISLKETPDSVIVNLSSNFGQGGGSESIENRVSQLSKTVKKRVGSKKVYLYIDNKEVEYLGGEGLYIKQPLD